MGTLFGLKADQLFRSLTPDETSALANLVSKAPRPALTGLAGALWNYNFLDSALAGRPVTNCTGTAHLQCTPCGCWLTHYTRNGGRHSDSCCVVTCGNAAKVGGHVWVPGRFGMFIVPLCDSCNGKDGELSISWAVEPIPPTASLACGQGRRW